MIVTDFLDPRTFHLLALVPGQPIVLAAIVVVGLWCHDSFLWRRIGFCLLASLIVNPFLKSAFGLPLPSTVGPGYAFPSGHYQGALMVYGGLMIWHRLTWLHFLSVVLLTLYAWAIIVNGYHVLMDVLGAVFFGALFLWGVHRRSQAHQHGIRSAWLSCHGIEGDITLFSATTLMMTWYMDGAIKLMALGAFCVQVCWIGIWPPRHEQRV